MADSLSRPQLIIVMSSHIRVYVCDNQNHPHSSQSYIVELYVS